MENLCEILKGHEEETFYTTIFGEVKLEAVLEDTIQIKTCYGCTLNIRSNGAYFAAYPDSECIIFPSKEERDWSKWVEANDTPKTWEEMKNRSKYVDMFADISNKGFETCSNSFIEKSALALLKIYQLINIGYGGNVTKDSWNRDTATIECKIVDDKPELEIKTNVYSIIAFHNKKLAMKFMSYPENVQLIKDYYII